MSQVLSSAIRLILSSASDGQTAAQKCIAFLYPCLSYILLSPSIRETESSQNTDPVLASSLHSQLVRLACSKPVLQVIKWGTVVLVPPPFCAVLLSNFRPLGTTSGILHCHVAHSALTVW